MAEGPLQLVRVLSEQTVADIVGYLEDYKEFLESDVSNYAKGRQRFWLQYEWSLRDRSFSHSVKCDRLWKYCKQLFPSADLGLCAFGSIGIGLHRDDSYADYTACTVNLGQVDGWLYEPSRITLGPGPQSAAEVQTVELPVGAVVIFNCKNRHGVLNPAPDRWSINLWHVKGEFRDQLP